MVLKMLCCSATLVPLLLAVLLSVSATHAEEDCSRDAMNACISDARTAFVPAFGKDGTASCNDSALTEKVCETFVDLAWCLITNECKYLENKTANVFSTNCTVKQFEDRCLGNPIYRFKRQGEETPPEAGDQAPATEAPVAGANDTAGNATTTTTTAEPATEMPTEGPRGYFGGGVQTTQPPKSSGPFGAANPLVLLLCHVAVLLAVLM